MDSKRPYRLFILDFYRKIFSGRDFNLYRYVLNDPVNYVDPADKTWWTKDNAGHGNSCWKQYEKKGKYLNHIGDFDEIFDILKNKHQGQVGKKIPWKSLFK